MVTHISSDVTIEQLFKQVEALQAENASLRQELEFIENVLLVDRTILKENDKLALLTIRRELKKEGKLDHDTHLIRMKEYAQAGRMAYNTFCRSTERCAEVGIIGKNTNCGYKGHSKRQKKDIYLSETDIQLNPVFDYPRLYSLNDAPANKRGGAAPKRCDHCKSTDLTKHWQLVCNNCGKVNEFGTIEINGSHQQGTFQNEIALSGNQRMVDSTLEKIDNILEEVDGRLEDEQQFQNEISEETPSSDNSKMVDSSSLIGVSQIEITPFQNGITNASVDTVGVQTELIDPPAELQALRQWVVWRYEDEPGKEKPRKVPYIAQRSRSELEARTNDLTTWRTYAEAKALYEESVKWGWKHPYSGVGFVFNGDYTGIDFDHCIIDGHIESQVAARLQMLHSYSETSPSGTGIHCIARGTIPSGRKRADIEMYDHGRFFTWTGRHIVGMPATVESRQMQLAELHAQIAPPAIKMLSPTVFTPRIGSTSQRSDEELLTLARSKSAKFADLWEGQWTAYGYPSQSEADAALCAMLAYWTDGSGAAIDRLFRQSKLYRPKWDMAARAGETYGEGTIRRVLEGRA